MPIICIDVVHAMIFCLVVSCTSSMFSRLPKDGDSLVERCMTGINVKCPRLWYFAAGTGAERYDRVVCLRAYACTLTKLNE